MPVQKRRLSTSQYVKLISFLTENKDKFQGQHQTKIADACSKELGHPVAPSSVRTVGKEIGLNVRTREYAPNSTKELKEDISKLKESVKELIDTTNSLYEELISLNKRVKTLEEKTPL